MVLEGEKNNKHFPTWLGSREGAGSYFGPNFGVICIVTKKKKWLRFPDELRQLTNNHFISQMSQMRVTLGSSEHLILLLFIIETAL